MKTIVLLFLIFVTSFVNAYEKFPDRFMVFSLAGQTASDNDLKLGYLYFKTDNSLQFQYFKFSPYYKIPLIEGQVGYGVSESWALRNYVHPNYDYVDTNSEGELMRENGELCTDQGKFRVPNYSSTGFQSSIPYTYENGILSFTLDGKKLVWTKIDSNTRVYNGNPKPDQWESRTSTVEQWTLSSGTSGYNKYKGLAMPSDLLYMPELSMTDNFDFAYYGQWWLSDGDEKDNGDARYLANQWIDDPANPLDSNISVHLLSDTKFRRYGPKKDGYLLDRSLTPSSKNVHGTTSTHIGAKEDYSQSTWAINSASIPSIIYQHQGFIYEGPKMSCYQTSENSGHLRMYMGAWSNPVSPDVNGKFKGMVGVEFSWELDGFPIWGIGYQLGNSNIKDEIIH